MKTILVVAPHADDESLGCGGTLLRHKEEGDSIHWLLVTGMSEGCGFSKEQIAVRDQEIEQVNRQYGFNSLHRLELPPSSLDTVAHGKIVFGISQVIEKVRPDVVYSPYRNDAHSDHKIVFDAVMAATKSFRYPFVKRVLTYETISETDFGMKPEDGGFKPNVYVDISSQLEKKLKILDIFASEMGEFPFPRCRRSLEALATLRGAQSNCFGAEAFVLIKEIL